MHCHLVKSKSFKVVMRRIKNSSAGSFVYAAALHTNKSVFYNIEKSDTVFAAEFIELEDNILGAEFFAVKRYRNALFKIKSDVCGSIGCLKGRNAHFKEAVLIVKRFVSCILKIKSLVRKVPEVLIL